MATSFPFNSISPVNNQGFAFNIEQLRDEVLADAGITTELGQILGSGTEDIEVRFIASLSGEEETALNAVVAIHIPRDFGIIVEGLTGEASGNVAMASAELNWFDNSNTIFESHTVQDVIEEISSLSWLNLVDAELLANAPILGNVGALGETGETGSQGNTGPAGDAGPAGNTGSAGATGEDGFIGSDGALGATGEQGATGSDGITNYEFFEDLTERNTTSKTFVEYARFITSSLTSGDYRIGWNYLWDGSKSNRDVVIQLELDDSDVLMEHFEEPHQGSEDQRMIASGFVVRTLTAGVHTLDLDFRREGNNSSSTIFEARIEILKVN